MVLILWQLLLYNAVREFVSMRYPKKGKKGIGNKNRSHNPPIKRMNFHLSLSFVYNILMKSFYMDLLRGIELLMEKKLCFSESHLSFAINIQKSRNLINKPNILYSRSVWNLFRANSNSAISTGSGLS